MPVNRARVTTLTLGTLTVTFNMHYLPNIGARVIVTLHEPPAPPVTLKPMTPIELREFCARGKLAACETESMERCEQRRKEHAA